MPFSISIAKPCLLALLVLLAASCSSPDSSETADTDSTAFFESQWQKEHNRHWAGTNYWANRLQDWHIQEGQMVCRRGDMALRTLHLLNYNLSDDNQPFRINIMPGRTDGQSAQNPNAMAGLLVGVGTQQADWRSDILVHGASGAGGGLAAVIKTDGRLTILDNTDNLKELATSEANTQITEALNRGEARLLLTATPDNQQTKLTLTCSNKDNKELAQISVSLPASRLTGQIALLSHYGTGPQDGQYTFENWTAGGPRLVYHPERTFGPVMAVKYLYADSLLKLQAQLPPIGEQDNQQLTIRLRPENTTDWKINKAVTIETPSYTALFEIPDWQDKESWEFELVYENTNKANKQQTFSYTGKIVAAPQADSQWKAAVISCNSNNFGSISTSTKNYDFDNEHIWFPQADLTRKIAYQQPALLVFNGDQLYEGSPSRPDAVNHPDGKLDYLYKWYLWCIAYGDLTRNVPTVCFPDDHDIYHGNLWGSSGKHAAAAPQDSIYPDYYLDVPGYPHHWMQDQGGYKMPADLVKMVEKTQTGNLPKPYNTEPIKQGITTYYTDFTYGGVSFAVLEDRKFKSAPTNVIGWAKVVNGFAQVDTPGVYLDNPEATLLGSKQLGFIEKWNTDWKDAYYKVALSQTVLGNISTYPDSFKTDYGTPKLLPLAKGIIPKDYSLAKDMDSNGWPQTARNKALETFRKGFALMVGGDQHLATVVHHGVKEHNDAGYSYAVPAVSNVFPRRWFPKEPGQNHQEGMPNYTGEYLDGFGNKITVLAAANPYKSNLEPANLYDRVPGYGMLVFEPRKQQVTLECWPRYAEPESGEQYDGWPITVTLEQGYGRKAAAWLPALSVKEMTDPVVQVVNAKTKETVYTRRFLGTQTEALPVFEAGNYTVIVSQPEKGLSKTMNLKSTTKKPDKAVEATL